MFRSQYLESAGHIAVFNVCWLGFEEVVSIVVVEEELDFISLLCLHLHQLILLIPLGIADPKEVQSTGRRWEETDATADQPNHRVKIVVGVFVEDGIVAVLSFVLLYQIEHNEDQTAQEEKQNGGE